VSRPTSDPESYNVAAQWFRQRLRLTGDDFLRVVSGSHERAFTVANVAQLEIVTEVWEALDAAIVKGETLKDFRARVEDRLTAAWGSSQPYRVETVFRTNVQHAYSRGRWEQQTDPAVKAIRPFWEYSAILDGRTTEHCRTWDGKILPADDPAWRGHNPPAHHNCRATLVSLTEEQAKARGGAVPPPATPAAEGFGRTPDEGDWHPDLTRYPSELAAVAASKLAMR
jgi:SPP1 gp7 family putative phage head morphogenesis protein